MIYRLVFLTGASKGVRLTVEPEPMVFGTDEDCQIRTDDIEMARRHAVIEQKPDGLWISDLGSMNKILINGRELQKSQLKHGDVVELGRTRFLVQAVVQAEYEGPAAAPSARKRHRRRVRVLLGLLALTGVVYWWTLPRFPSPASRSADPLRGVAPTQAVAAAETVINVAFVTNIVVQTAAVDVATTPADRTEFETVLRELQGLKKMVTSMVATVKSGDAVTSSVTDAASPVAGSREPAPRLAVTRPEVNASVPREIRPRVVDVEQQRFLGSGDYDEMRILRIKLAWRPDEAPDPADRVSLVVAFFEQDLAGRGVVPSRVSPPRRIEISGDVWLKDSSTVVTASYVIPKGTLSSGHAATRVGQYHGYVIRVCRGNEILDAYARPQALLDAEMTALE